MEAACTKTAAPAMMNKIRLSFMTIYSLLSTGFCNAQVGEVKETAAVPVEFGQGFMKAADYTHYLLSFSAAPMKSFQQKKMNKWRAGVVINYFSFNPGDDWSFGARIGYRLNKSGELGNIFNCWLYPEYSYSPKDKKNLLGLGVAVALNPLEFSVHPQYETQSQKMWFTSKLGFNMHILFEKKENKKSDDPFQ